MVSPPEESGGAGVQLQPRGGQEAPELIQSLPPSLQHQGDTRLTVQSAYILNPHVTARNSLC